MTDKAAFCAYDLLLQLPDYLWIPKSLLICYFLIYASFVLFVHPISIYWNNIQSRQ